MPSQQQNNQTSTYVRESFQKALMPSAKWEDKDQFLDVIYWLKQILGLVIGLVWGVLPLKGMLGMILFFAINALIVYCYSIMYQRIDEEEFGGFMEILKEGMMTSFASFLIAWIIVFDGLYSGVNTIA